MKNENIIGNISTTSGETASTKSHIQGMATSGIMQMEKKIGKTTFIVTTGFNGDKTQSIGATLARIISRDVAGSGGTVRISA